MKRFTIRMNFSEFINNSIILDNLGYQFIDIIDMYTSISGFLFVEVKQYSKRDGTYKINKLHEIVMTPNGQCVKLFQNHPLPLVIDMINYIDMREFIILERERKIKRIMEKI